MAEIEFERRGTPLWAVVLALLVVAGIIWAIVARSHGGSTATPAVARVDSATEAAAAKGVIAHVAPAAVAGPSTKLKAWVDSAKMPAGADAQHAYLADGLTMLGNALQERAPLSGVQINLVKANADTMRMPGLPGRKYLDATQSAFFAAAYALRQTNAGNALNDAASRVVLTTPLEKQGDALHHFFVVAANALRQPITVDVPKPDTGPKPGAPGPKGKS